MRYVFRRTGENEFSILEKGEVLAKKIRISQSSLNSRKALLKNRGFKPVEDRRGICEIYFDCDPEDAVKFVMGA